MTSFGKRFGAALGRVLGRGTAGPTAPARPAGPRPSAPRPGPPPGRSAAHPGAAPAAGHPAAARPDATPGAMHPGATTSTGPPKGRHLEYAPQLDGRADPGEIVWTWVTFEEDAHQGKDRPVLVVGRNDSTLLGLMLSSQHDRDGQHNWFALGPGGWDRENRPSWVRLDRVLRIDEAGVRREGSILPRDRFEAVAAELRSGYGWR